MWVSFRFKNKKMDENNNAQTQSKFMTWLKRIGVVGFLFFLIKGLVWIGVFIWAGTCALK